MTARPRAIPHTRAADWHEVRPGTFAAQIEREDPGGCHVALLGLPDDNGVALNHGRAGAIHGPGCIRAALATLGAPYDASAGRAIDVRVFDAGDVEIARGRDVDALSETHRRVREAAAAVHERGMLLCAIGGGHDLTYPAVRALFDVRSPDRPLAGINLDAHLDVRETPGSGMPFRKLVEEGALRPDRFVELGIAPFANAAAHLEWADGRGIERVSVEQLLGRPEDIEVGFARAFRDPADCGFATLCLDAIDRAFAPGVSAANPLGLAPVHALRFARAAGAHPRIHHFDVMELCPPHDVEGATARLAATIVLAFLSALSARLAATCGGTGGAA